MPEWTLILEVPAREFYQQDTTPAEKRRLEELFHAIMMEPWVDGETKFEFHDPPNIAVIYYDPQFWIIYSIIDYQTVSIVNIGFEEEIPRKSR